VNNSHTPVSTLRVLTLNTWGLPLGLSKDKTQRLRNIGAEIAASDFDLIGLQEIWDPRDLKPILAGAKAAGLRYYHHYGSAGLGSGLVLFSRFPIVDVNFRRFRLRGSAETSYHGDYIAGKGIGLARIQIPGELVDVPSKLIDVYLLHTIAQYQPDSHDNYKAHRAAQHYEAARFITSHSTENPVIVMGDFNSRPDQLPNRLFKTLVEVTDCFSTLHPNDPCNTYDPINPYLPANDPPRCLDYIFVRDSQTNRLIPSLAEIVFRTTARPGLNGARTAFSDHYGMATELQMQEAGGNHSATSPGASAVLEELLATLKEGLLYARSRRERHSRGWKQAASLVVPAVLIGKMHVKWLRNLLLPIIALAVMVGLVFAQVTIPQEIGDMRAISREAEIHLQALRKTEKSKDTKRQKSIEKNRQ
jgi:endonuclease/exonuclease/phosphatase family metal-dependent hydrolase